VTILLYIGYNYVAGLFSQRDKLKQDLVLKQTEIKQLVNKNNQLVSVVTKVQKVSSDQLRRASDSIFKLKDKEARLQKEVTRLSVLNQAVKLKGTITASYKDTGKIDTADYSCEELQKIVDKAVITPSAFSYESDSISLTGTVMDKNTGVQINSLYMPNTMYERDIVKKSGFLGLGRKRETQLYNTNPLWSNDSAAVYTVDKSPNWWYRTGKPTAAAGIATAVTIIIMKSIINASK
jgi:hypothetical protein